MKLTNPKTGAVIQGEATNADIVRAGRSDIIHFCCVNCDEWAEYRVSKPTRCPNCGGNPAVRTAAENIVISDDCGLAKCPQCGKPTAAMIYQAGKTRGVGCCKETFSAE